MYEVNQLTKHRVFTMHLLRRFMRHHCPISLVVEIDVTDLMAKIESMRSEGTRVGFVAWLTKATAMTIESHPELNNRIFQGLFGPIILGPPGRPSGWVREGSHGVRGT